MMNEILTQIRYLQRECIHMTHHHIREELHAIELKLQDYHERNHPSADEGRPEVLEGEVPTDTT